MKNISNNTIVVGIVGVVVGLVLGWLIGHYGAVGKASVASSDPEKNSVSTTMSTESKPTNALSTNSGVSEESQSAILVRDQGAGSVVTVASVETDASVWVVVREDNNGVLGNILGASRIESGASNNIVVNLLRPTLSGKTYQIVLFKDDGNKLFDYKVDVPLTSNGVLISKPFRVM